MQLVRESITAPCDGSGEKPCVMSSHELRDFFAGFTMEHGYARDSRVEGAYHKITCTGLFMHTEKRKRIVVIASDDG
jgi:hypothetical protein